MARLCSFPRQRLAVRHPTHESFLGVAATPFFVATGISRRFTCGAASARKDGRSRRAELIAAGRLVFEEALEPWIGASGLPRSARTCQRPSPQDGTRTRRERHTWARIGTVSVDEIADRLYALPHEEFTQARNQAERELRRAGEREQADRVKALRKPTAAAGAANRLVREHRPEVDTFLAAAASLRDAQVAGKGNVASAATLQREALQKLVDLGGEPVRATLQAAAVDDNAARDLLAARLVREPEPAGFGTLLAHSEPKAAKASTANRAAPRKRGVPAPARPDDSAARAKLQEAKKMLGAAKAEERQAKRRWTHTQRDLERAQAAVEKAQHQLDRLHDR